jgi:hypothetical protein
MQSLERKHLVKRVLVGRAHVYEAAYSREAIVQHAAHDFLTNVFGGRLGEALLAILSTGTLTLDEKTRIERELQRHKTMPAKKTAKKVAAKPAKKAVKKVAKKAPAKKAAPKAAPKAPAKKGPCQKSGQKSGEESRQKRQEGSGQEGGEEDGCQEGPGQESRAEEGSRQEGGQEVTPTPHRKKWWPRMHGGHPDIPDRGL